MLPYRDTSLSVEHRVRDLLARMTLEEKVAQILNADVAYEDFTGQNGPETAGHARERLSQGAGAFARPGGARTPRQTAELVNAIQTFLLEQTRLGIPAFFQEEALHGLMAAGATCFPQAIALASTWDPALVEQIFHATALETRTRGATHVFTPVLDLARDPRWGRTEETYGEDPHLVSRIGVAAIRGLQGNDSTTRAVTIDSRHVLATAKHFAAHGQPEAGTNCGPANYAERELRETFLAPFQAAITEAGAQTVMASYNEINGIPVHINRWILHDILRGEWGFSGLVISDGGGLQMLVNEHHVAASWPEAARKALAAGIDFDLSNGEVFATLVEEARAGRVPETLVNRAVENVLRLKFQLGLFEHPFADPDLAEQVTNCAEHQALAYQAAVRALTLLKNEGNLLPFDPANVHRLAVIGPNAADLHVGGYSQLPVGQSVVEGLRAFGADHGIEILYAEGCRLTEGEQGWMRWWWDENRLTDPASNVARIAEAVEVARQADAVLLVLGENEALCREAWAPWHTGDRDSLDLPGDQDALAKAVLAAGKPTAALLLNGRPLSVNFLAENVPALLEGWYLGQATGPAVADVLFGAAAPGGRLPVTFPRSVGQIPAYYYHKPSARRSYALADKTPLFPFGHGLTYTTFDFKNLSITPAEIGAGGTAQVQVQVTNTGAHAGEVVVQLYIRDCLSSVVTRPVMALKAFRRVLLQPGETRPVEFTLGPDALAYWDEHMQWYVEPGEFEILVGESSAQTSAVKLVVRA